MSEQAELNGDAELIASAALRQNEIAVFVAQRIKPDQRGLVDGRFEKLLAIRLVQQASSRHAPSNRVSGNRSFPGRSPSCPERVLDNGKPDRMIVGQENGRVRENCDDPDRLCTGFDGRAGTDAPA